MYYGSSCERYVSIFECMTAVRQLSAPMWNSTRLSVTVQPQLWGLSKYGRLNYNMDSGDGSLVATAKKKSGGGKGSGSPTPGGGSLETPPPRVDPNSLISVRQQIRYVKAMKTAMSKTAYRAPKAPQTYRKETKTAEEYKQIRLEAEKEAALLSKKESKNFALRKLYNTNSKMSLGSPKQMRHCPVLLVDGYNVLHLWKRTQELMEEGELEEAREILIHALEVYSKMNGVRVVVAFDALHGPFGNHGTMETLLESGVTVAFCGDKEADSFISLQARSWVERGCPQVVVATNDSTLQVAVQTTKTHAPQVCFAVPSSGLINDMEGTEKRAMSQVGDGTGTPDLCLLECVVQSKDPGTFSALQNLRQSLITGGK